MVSLFDRLIVRRFDPAIPSGPRVISGVFETDVHC